MKRRLIPQTIVTNLVNMNLIPIVSMINTMKMIMAMKNWERIPRRALMEDCEK